MEPRIVNPTDEDIQQVDDKTYIIIQKQDRKPDWFLIGSISILGISILISTFWKGRVL